MLIKNKLKGLSFDRPFFYLQKNGSLKIFHFYKFGLKQVIEEIYANYLSVISMGYFDKVIPKFILNKMSILLTLEKYSHGILAELNFCGPKEIKTLDFIKMRFNAASSKNLQQQKYFPQ